MDEQLIKLKKKKLYPGTKGNIKIKMIFIQALAEILLYYKNYIYYINDVTIFNKKKVYKKKREEDEKFYSSFVETNIFKLFIDHYFTKPEKFFFEEYYKKYFQEKQKEDINLKEYFEKYIKNKQTQNNLNFIEEYLCDFNIKFKKNYQINFEDNKSKKYKLNNSYFNKKGILEEDQRIIKNEIVLLNKNDPKYYKIFQISEDLHTLSSFFKIQIPKESKINVNIDKNMELILFKSLKNIFLEENIDENKEIIMEIIQAKQCIDFLIIVISSVYKKDYYVKKVEKDISDCLSRIYMSFGIIGSAIKR